MLTIYTQILGGIIAVWLIGILFERYFFKETPTYDKITYSNGMAGIALAILSEFFEPGDYVLYVYSAAFVIFIRQRIYNIRETKELNKNKNKKHKLISKRAKIYIFIIILISALFGMKNLKYIYDFGRGTPKISNNGLFLKCDRTGAGDSNHYIVLNKNLFGKYNKLFSITLNNEFVTIWESEKFQISNDKTKYIASEQDIWEHWSLGVQSDITTTYSLNRNDLKLEETRRDNLEKDYRYMDKSKYYSCSVFKDNFFSILKTSLENENLFNKKNKKQEKKLQKEREDKNKI